MNKSLNLELIGVDNEVFYNEICYGLSKNEIHNELKIVDGNIVFSPRLFLRSLSINDKVIESYFKIFSKTKSSRIRKKYDKLINTRIELYMDGVSNFL